ncbi:MAG: hypothetical protein GMKNLPBB_03108 [Myxococcota bacterium]|nr:hypothetical protein [Myxococcota bacterium]
MNINFNQVAIPCLLIASTSLAACGQSDSAKKAAAQAPAPQAQPETRAGPLPRPPAEAANAPLAPSAPTPAVNAPLFAKLKPLLVNPPDGAATPPALAVPPGELLKGVLRRAPSGVIVNGKPIAAQPDWGIPLDTINRVDVVIDHVKSKGPVEQSDVDFVIQKYRIDLQVCHAQHLPESDTASRDLQVIFNLNQQGRAEHIRFPKSDKQPLHYIACLTEALQRPSYRPPSGPGEVEVTARLHLGWRKSPPAADQK